MERALRGRNAQTSSTTASDAAPSTTGLFQLAPLAADRSLSSGPRKGRRVRATKVTAMRGGR